MKNVQTIFLETIALGQLTLADLGKPAKDFILGKNPNAICEPFKTGDRSFIVKDANGLSLGFGETEDAAWEDAVATQVMSILD